jgi:hypothetical protein
MQPKRPNYLFYAMQAFVVFGALNALWAGPLFVPWLATPVGQSGHLLAIMEYGTFGAVAVSFLAWAVYKIQRLRAQP